MLKFIFATLLCASLTSHAAEDRRAYRHVDAAGRVTYSQTPPVNGQPTQEVSIRPAQSGRGGVVMPYNEYFPGSAIYGQSAQWQSTRYSNTAANTNAREQQLAALKAQCVANRGTDCNNPRALQYLQASQLPRSAVVVVRPR